MDFSRDCERWRAWARTNLAGTDTQVASAGDAAALTGLLGSLSANDSIAAARAAGALNGEAAPLAVAWASAGYPVQSPEATFQRLAEAGWEPVPLTGHRLPVSGVACVAAWTAERVIGKLETVEVKSLAQQVGEEVGFWAPDSLIGGLIGEAVIGGIARAASGGKKTEVKRVWKKTGKFQYLISPNGMFFWDGGKGGRYGFGEFKAMEYIAAPSEGVQVLVMDNIVFQFRGPQARLHSLVLESLWRQYWAGRLTDSGRARKAVADRKDPVTSPPEAISLARSFRDIGYLQGAVEYFEIATTASEPTVGAEAFNELGNIWSDQGDLNRARDCYTRAAAIGGPNVKACALRNLALTERKAGKPEAVIAACKGAIETNHSQYAPSAMFILGATYEDDMNDPVNARRAYELAIASGDADYAPRAAYFCGHLVHKAGDNVTAVNLLQKAATSGHKEFGPRATYWLARWYGLDWGDPITGRRLLEEVVATGHSDWAVKAGELLKQRPFAGVGATS